MSELIRWQDKDLSEYYNADKVDAVLANKDYEIAELKKSIGRLLKADIDQVMDEVVRRTLIYGDGLVPVEHAMKLVVEVRRQKHKRCLAMAKLCAKNVDHLNSEGYIYEKENLVGETDDCIKRAGFYHRWYNRWMEFAEHFKEVK